MITSVLVANRGEIARRVFRTCRDLGLGTVALFSDADADSPHVREADAAVRLPGSAPSETYLRGELIVDAARRAGADAVHPGYGFLSENAAFAQAVIDAGLTWIGPSPAAIAAMGSKIESKRMMAAAGVPTLAELTPENVTAEDLPVLIKASAGGGGRGMRVVRELAALPAEADAARAEAQSAFGDPTVFCEPYLVTGRHIEVQIMADAHGTVWAVGERECSIQRRHQKVVEEAPSPLVERVAGMRERLFDAARAAAKAIGYTGAGTVEFLADEQGRFFFLEMNTRLQVEHPVTECTTGLDLVALQVAVADGHRLPEHPPAPHGHAIEVRLYAEDPAADWQPQSGPVHRFAVPGVRARFEVGGTAQGIRLDSGVEDGSTVGIHYDPMLAKVISWASTRDTAAAVLATALARAKIHGLTTNRDLLVNVLRHPAFVAGDTDTAFFDTHGLDALAQPLADERVTEASALAAALAAEAAAPQVLPGIPRGWRNVPSQDARAAFDGPFGPVEVTYRKIVESSGAQASQKLQNGVPGRARADAVADADAMADADAVVVELDGVRHTFDVARYGRDVFVDSPLGPVHLVAAERFADPADLVAPGSLLAPMPGSVVRLAVSPGDTVRAGQPILWLEAMKMQHQISAPSDGVVSELPVRQGQQVEVGAVLAVVTDAATIQEAQ